MLDLSAQALEQAKRRIGPDSANVEWIVADVTKWKPGRQYEVWHDRAAFHFLTEADDRRAYLGCLRAALAPGGPVIIGTFALDGPEKCSGLPVQRYDSKGLAEQLGASFELAETRSEMHGRPGTRIRPFSSADFVGADDEL